MFDFFKKLLQTKPAQPPPLPTMGVAWKSEVMTTSVIPSSPCCGHRKPTCTRCLVAVANMEDLSQWLVLQLEGIDRQFTFCPRCRPHGSVTPTEYDKRLASCKRWAHFQLKAECN